MREVKGIKWEMKDSSLIDNYILFHEEIMLLITQILSLLVSDQILGIQQEITDTRTAETATWMGQSPIIIT